MTRQLLAAAALILVPALGFAQTPPGPDVQPLKQGLAGVKSAFTAVEECFAELAWFRSDLAKKKASLAEEFKGRVPADFDQLLAQKTLRIENQHKRCVQQHDDLGKSLTELHAGFRAVGAMNAPLKKLKLEADTLNSRYNKLLPTAKPATAPAKKRQNAE